MTNSESTSLTSSKTLSVGLQTKTGIAISSDEEGIVKTWDISTGLCKTSFQTPAGDNVWRDARLIDGRSIVVWYNGNQIYISGNSKDDSPKMVAKFSSGCKDLRISGDGSNFFCLSERSIQAWSTHTREPVGEVKLELEQEFYLDPFLMDGLKIWI